MRVARLRRLPGRLGMAEGKTVVLTAIVFQSSPRDGAGRDLIVLSSLTPAPPPLALRATSPDPGESP